MKNMRFFSLLAEFAYFWPLPPPQKKKKRFPIGPELSFSIKNRKNLIFNTERLNLIADS